MRFTVGDSVKLTVDKHYSDGTTIVAGSRGVIQRVYGLSASYLVKFAGYSKERRVLEPDLAAA